MNAKELIQGLLECEMDSTVEVIINSNGYDETFEGVELRAKRIYNSEYAQLHIDIGSMILVEKDEFEEMEEKISGLESEVESLRDMLAER